MTDSERLDWLENVGGYLTCMYALHPDDPSRAKRPWRCDTGDEKIGVWGATAREAIDAAMARAAKPEDDPMNTSRFHLERVKLFPTIPKGTCLTVFDPETARVGDLVVHPDGVWRVAAEK